MGGGKKNPGGRGSPATRTKEGKTLMLRESRFFLVFIMGKLTGNGGEIKEETQFELKGPARISRGGW